MIDQLNDPLMHLIRNCMDHGIEAADVTPHRGQARDGQCSSFGAACGSAGCHFCFRRW